METVEALQAGGGEEQAAQLLAVTAQLAAARCASLCVCVGGWAIKCLEVLQPSMKQGRDHNMLLHAC